MTEPPMPGNDIPVTVLPKFSSRPHSTVDSVPKELSHIIRMLEGVASWR